EQVFGVSLKGGLRQDFGPLSHAAPIAGFEGAGLRVVAFEVRGIYDDAVRDAGKAEPDDAPVVPWSPAAARLPAVHPFAERRVFAFDEDRLRRVEQVFLGREEFVVR